MKFVKTRAFSVFYMFVISAAFAGLLSVVKSPTTNGSPPAKAWCRCSS